jgi:flagellar biosynthetic protein FlhB
MAKDDKTEAPTPKRKREARKKGQIPKSAEVVTWLQVLVATYLLQLTVHRAGGALRTVLAQVRDAIARPDEGVALGLLGEGLRGAVIAVLPLTGAMMAVGVLGHVAQTGGFASLSLLKPKPERLNPLQGIKRLASPQALWQAAKSLLKVGVLVLVAWPPLDDLTRSLVASGHLQLGQVAAAVAATALRIARNTALLGLLIAGVDYGLQRRKVMQGMKMTKQEVRDEHRQSEGDPQMKGQIRQRQLAIGRNRMISAVADANVVIVNPTHVAVALRYQPGRGAPRVVAKGKGEVARRIREEAERHFVPMVRDVHLARTIESSVRLGGEIPADLYEAVARVLAFLTQLGGRTTFGGILQIPQPAR